MEEAKIDTAHHRSHQDPHGHEGSDEQANESHPNEQPKLVAHQIYRALHEVEGLNRHPANYDFLIHEVSLVSSCGRLVERASL